MYKSSVNALSVSVSHLLISLSLLIFLSGGYTLSRIGLSENDLPVWLNEVRFFFFIPYVVLVLARVALVSDLLAKPPQLYSAWVTVLVVFFLYMCATTAWAPSIGMALQRLPDMLIVSFIVVSTPVAVGIRVRHNIRFLLGLLIAIGLLYSLAGIINGGISSSGRISAFGGGPNVFARVVGMGMIASIYFWNRTTRVLWLLPLIPMGIALVLSGSRGGLLATLLAHGILLLLIVDWKKRSSYLHLFLALLFSIVTLFFTTIGQQVIDFWNDRFYQTTLIEGYTSNRDYLAQVSLMMISQKPFIGHGLDAFPVLSGTAQPYPHNLFLEVGVEGGLLGLLLLLSVFITSSIQWRRPKSQEQLVAFSIATLYFIASMFSGGLYDTRFLWFFLAIFLLGNEAHHDD